MTRKKQRWGINDVVNKGLLAPDAALNLLGESNAPIEQLRGRSKRGRRDIEADEQSQLIAIYRATYPQYAKLLIHIPNGGSRANAFEGWRLKQQGVQAGVSDLLLALPVPPCPGLWIEFKAAPPNSAPVTQDQLDWLALMRSNGYEGEVCRGVHEAIGLIRQYLSGVV